VLSTRILVQRAAHSVAALVLLAAGHAFAQPGCGIAVDGQGSIFFADTGRGPWRIDANGKVTPHDGPAYRFLALDPEGRFAGAKLPSSASTEMKHAGQRPTVIFSRDVPIAIGSDEALYFPQAGQDGRLQIVRLRPSGAHEVMATLPATSEEGPLEWLNGIAAGPDGSVAYSENRAIRKVTKEGTITTVATSIEIPGCAPPAGFPTKLGPHLRGLAVASDGSIVVAATGCSAVVKITPDGTVMPLLRAVAPWTPTGVALKGDDVFVLEYVYNGSDDRRSWLPRVRKLAADGKISLLAEVALKDEKPQ
jgi:hypothetical protein